MTTGFFCVTCGTRFTPSAAPPPACPICRDERQYVGAGGQRWTTHAELARQHRNAWQRLEPGLYGIGSVPQIAIGQRALLLIHPEGNVLWDCISLLDEATIDLVRALGGLRAIAISHPHYYSAMTLWAEAFDAEILLHAADRAHVMDPHPAITWWSGPTHDLGAGLTLINAPSHFAGATMLHWQQGAEGHGALLSGDIVNVVPDRRHVSFMRSYPNLIPLPAAAIHRITGALEPFAFDRIYAAWWNLVVMHDAKQVVARSAARYIKWISDGEPE